MRYFVVFIVLGLLPFAQAGGWSPDANTGQDASNAESSALVVNDGTYTGWLPRADVDWYQTPSAPSMPLCIEAFASSGGATSIELVAGSTRGVIDLANSGRGAVAGVGSAPYFGLTNVGTKDAPYMFDIETVRATGTGDNGGSTDTSAELADATPISPGCTTGAVGSLAPLDTRDVYSFNANAADVSIVTLGSSSPTGMRLELLESDGDLLASIVPGQALQVALPQTGTYFITTTPMGIDMTNYAIGLVVGPPTQGCRPMCMMSS